MILSSTSSNLLLLLMLLMPLLLSWFDPRPRTSRKTWRLLCGFRRLGPCWDKRVKGFCQRYKLFCLTYSCMMSGQAVEPWKIGNVHTAHTLLGEISSC